MKELEPAAIEQQPPISVTGDELDQLVEGAEQLPKVEDSRIRQLRELKEKRLLSLARKYDPEVHLLKLNDVSFFAKGDLVAIKSKQKQGKTHAIVTMLATLLGSECFRIRALQQQVKIVYIDTEQKELDTDAIYRKVMRLSALPEKDRYDIFQVYTMREEVDPEKMMADIELIIEEEKPDAVFIDGVVDLIGDFNDVSTSRQLVRSLMSLATVNQCAIAVVLHTNKAQEDHNMRGHLGTMLSQKCQHVFETTKSDSNIVTVKCCDYRHAPLDTWSFTWDADGELISADEAAAEEINQKEADKAERARQAKKEKDDKKFSDVEKILKANLMGIPRSSLAEELARVTGKSRSTMANYITACINEDRLSVDDSGNVTLVEG